ncbi:MAG: hypothetical protein NTX26_03170 [Candidatus Parcubacteria bacterium]|nr:hypothetical protein [Candidatus Parcubacteria bacterium]
MLKSSNHFEILFFGSLVLLGAIFSFIISFPKEGSSDTISSSVKVVIVTTTTTTVSGGGGGGGGGGYNPPPSQTKVIFEGRAYPLSKVSILKDGQLTVSTIAGPDAKFYVALEGLSSGNYLFAVYSEDSQGGRSALFTFPVFVTIGATTQIGGIFLSPTIDVNKTEVKKGEIIKIFGQTVPDSDVTVIVNSDSELYGKTKSDQAGAYLYNLDTLNIEIGDHSAKSRSSLDGDISSLSQTVGFKVGLKDILKQTFKCPPKADLNSDCHVNLIDFSIAAYWYKKPLSVSFKQIEKNTLNGDGKIDLVDFSIMAYYWTG